MPQSQAMGLLAQSENNEWYTPKVYVDAARYTMGGIELDPASSDAANKTVKATRFFTIEDDGLNQPWIADSVFLNPPYGKTKNKSNQGLWAEKLLAEYNAGNVKQGIILVNLYYGYNWFAPLRELPMCLVDHRISFIDPLDEEKDDEAKASSAFLYLGSDFKRFKSEFSRFGKVVRPIQWRQETCLVCGDMFTPKAWGGKQRIYCGAACKQKAYRSRAS
jgi:hypothetical protein